MIKKIEIYQIKRDCPNSREIRFEDYETVKSIIGNIKQNFKSYYEKKYECEEDFRNQSDEETLDLLFIRFNQYRPEDFKGHSLSVSDIIIINDKIYFCDSFGWQQID